MITGRECKGRTPEKVLEAVLAGMEENPREWWACGEHSPHSSSPARRAGVYRVRPGLLLVSGDEELAVSLRRLLAEGAAPGWDVVLPPAIRRPLSELEAHVRQPLRGRVHNILGRQGFAYVEDVELLPDKCLQDFRLTGRQCVAAIRQALEDLAASVSGPDAAGLDQAAQGAESDSPLP